MIGNRAANDPATDEDDLCFFGEFRHGN